MKNKYVKKIIYCLYLLLLLSFIFGNSIASREESANQSGAIVESINQILQKVNSPFLLKDIVVRKLAHFTEFFVLGASFFGYLLIDKKVAPINTFYAVFASCIVAMTDETIQIFSNRGSMLFDVWLDFFSAVLAIYTCYLIFIIRNKTNKNNP